MNDADQLEKAAREAEARSEAQRRRAAEAEDRTRERERADAAKERKATRTPPDGVGFQTGVPAFWAALALGMATVIARNLDADIPRLWLLGPWVAGVLGFGLRYLWLANWRSRLGYALKGFDSIAGKWPRDDDRAPILAFEVRVEVLPEATDEQRRAVFAALRLLVATANGELEGDDDYRAATRWGLDGDVAAHGEGTLGFYRGGLWRKWLSGPMRVAYQAGGVDSVRITARYTAKSFRLPSGD